MSGIDPSTMTDAEIAAALGVTPAQPQPGPVPVAPDQSGPAPLPVQSAPLPPVAGYTITGPNGAATDIGSLSDAQIRQLVGAPAEPHMGTMEDAARSIGANLAQGGAQLAGAPGDLTNLIANAPGFLYHEGKNALFSPKGIDAADKADPFQPQDFAHLASLPGMMIGEGLPTSAQIDTQIQGDFGPYHQPQTPYGKYAGAIAQFVPAAIVGPESLGMKAIGAVVPAVASQAAADAATASGHPELAPYARLGGAVAGGGALTLATRPSGAQRLLASQGVAMTPEDLARAEALRQQAEAQGIPITIAEAAQQVSGNAYPLAAKLQQRVESSAAGAPIMGPMMTARPANARDALADTLASLGSATDQPSVVGLQAQQAAKGAIGNLQGERTALVQPYYTAAANTTVDPDAMQGLMASLDQRIAADKTGVLAKPLSTVRDLLTDQDATDGAALAAQGDGPAPQSLRDQLDAAWRQQTGEEPMGGSAPAPAAGRVPLLDIENLNRARQWLRDNAETSVGRGSLTPEQGGALHGVADQLDTMMRAASPDYIGGNANYAQFTRDNIDPVTAGPVGKIAATNSLPAQGAALFPAKPYEGAPAETTAAVGALNDQQEGLAAALARLHLGNQGTEAMQDLPSGPNLYGPARFAAGVAGNPEQAATLYAGLNAIDPTGETADNLQKLLGTFGATGRRLPATPADDLAAALLTSGTTNTLEPGVAFGVAKEAGGPLGPLALAPLKVAGAVKDYVNKARVNANAADLARAFTSPADQTSSIMTGAQDRVALNRQMLAQAIANLQIGVPQSAGR